MRPTYRTVETVYVGSSLRPEGERLVEEGVRVARAAGARVHLVHAYTPEPLSLRWEPTGIDAPSFHALCASRLAALRDQAHRLGIGVAELAGLTAEPGRAAELLAEKASGPGSLLVVGAAERVGPLARLLGSTANAVVRRASCPVLVLRAERVWPPRRALYAVDLSPASAEAFGAGVAVVREICGGEAPAGEVLFVLSPEERERSLQFGAAQLERMAGEELHRFVELHAPCGETLRERVAVGGAAAEVVDRAAGADLVVVGTHGRSGVERLLVGSVAAEIVRSAPCNVLVVPLAAACELAPIRHAEEVGEPDWLFHFG